jgi:DNA invertase Pin-like site-specific DNA recombinase
MLDPELDVSGGKVERPILGAAIAAIEQGQAAGIIVAQLDRLSRMDITDALHTIKRIEAAGAQVIAVAENFDAGTPEGKMGRTVFLAMGEMQLDRYKAQFRTAKAQAIERGIWPMPKVPIGYTKGPDRRLIPNDDAPLVVRAFEMRAAGASWSRIAERLHRGPTRARHMITNRAYLGEIHMGEWSNLNAHEPIVPRDLWEAAQIYHPPPPRSEREPALLAGLVRCAGCGYRMSVDSHRQQSPGAYKCRPHKAGGICPAPAIVSQRRLEGIVRETVMRHLRSLTFTATERTNVLEQAQVELNTAEAELALYQEVTKISEVGVEHFGSGMKHRAQGVEAARRNLARARLTVPALPASGQSIDDLTTGQERALLRGALGVVWVRKDRRRAGIRIIAAGFEPGEFDPCEWPDIDLPGEIRALGL